MFWLEKRWVQNILVALIVMAYCLILYRRFMKKREQALDLAMLHIQALSDTTAKLAERARAISWVIRQMPKEHPNYDAVAQNFMQIQIFWTTVTRDIAAIVQDLKDLPMSEASQTAFVNTLHNLSRIAHHSVQISGPDTLFQALLGPEIPAAGDQQE